MADIYQIPEGNSGTPQFTIPIGGMGGGFGLGNGMNGIVDLFGLAIIASIFGWGDGGFGGFGGGNAGAAGFLSNQLNNDSGRELIMNAINSNGEASRTAIQSLATMLGQDFNLVNNAVGNVQNALSTLAAQQGMSTLQVINSIQAGNSDLASRLAQCCCENRLTATQQGYEAQIRTLEQTNTLAGNATANTQAILGKLDAMQTQALQDKLDAARAENTRLAGEISQAQQNQVIASMIGNAVNPLAAQLAGIRSEVDSIKRCQPSTITLPNNSMTAVPSIWANAVADNIVDKISAALTPTTTPTTGGTGA